MEQATNSETTRLIAKTLGLANKKMDQATNSVESLISKTLGLAN